MFKNLKISAGMNALMAVFFIFLVAISCFNINRAMIFDTKISHAVAVSTANNPIQAATSSLKNAVALAVLASINENSQFEKTGVRHIDKEMISNIDKMVDQANSDFKIFIHQPAISPEERMQAHRLEDTYDDLLNFLLSIRNALVDPASKLPEVLKLEEKSSQYRLEFQKELDNYKKVLNAVESDEKAQSDKINSRMMILVVFMLGVSIVMVIIARIWLEKTLFSRLRQTRETFALLASGNLSQPTEIGASNEIGEMLVELEKMRVSLTSTVADIRLGVTSIHGSAQEIASSNNELSSRTEQQASALQQTAASMEELKITVRQNADNAHSARQLVEGANSSARKGGEVMVNLDGIMQEITQNSRQIADINGVIDSIANQTNILALNAAVEAARAGEQGRGFAVVAGEVRSLAKRSADAAKEIRQLINVCVANMDTGSQEVELAGKAMDEVVKSVTQVTDIMLEITSASDEQSIGINQIAQAVNEMDSVTQQNASMVEQAASVARSVEKYAHNLEYAVSQFVLPSQTGVNEQHDNKPATQSKIKKPIVRSEPAFSSNKADSDWTSF